MSGRGLPCVRVIHTRHGRTRMRLDGARDARALARVVLGLRGFGGVDDVELRARTRCVVVHHAPELRLASLGAYARERDLFDLVLPSHPVPASRVVRHGVAELARRVDRWSDGTVDLRTLGMITLLGAAALQVARGQALPAATTLLAYAVRLALNDPDAVLSGDESADAADAAEA